MSFIHKDSCECLKTELDLFTAPLTQTAIESGIWSEYNPITSIGEANPIEFNAQGTGSDYIDLAATQIQVRAQIVLANGNPIDNTHHVGPINLFLHSLFADVEVKLNDIQVSSSNNLYPYRAMLETLLSYGSACKQSQLQCSLYYKDQAERHDMHDPTDANGNAGLRKRYAHVRAGRIVDLLGTLHTDLIFQEKFLPSDVGMRIRLIRSKNAFCLMTNDQNPAYRVKILECKLLIRKAKISPSVYLAHARAFEVGNAKYNIRRALCKSYTIAAGAHDDTHEALFTGQVPTRLVICMVDNDAYNGTYVKSPFAT